MSKKTCWRLKRNHLNLESIQAPLEAMIPFISPAIATGTLRVVFGLESDQVFNTVLVVNLNADLLLLLRLLILTQRSKLEAEKLVLWNLTLELFTSFIDQVIKLSHWIELIRILI